MQVILGKLIEVKDDKFAEFNRGLLPTVPREKVIGVKTSFLRKIAIWVAKNGLSEQFLAELPHEFFEENQLHAYILGSIKDYDDCLNKVIAFLPHIDNWATCDCLLPKAFIRRPELVTHIEKWIASPHEYTVRFGVSMLMRHFSGELFEERFLSLVASIRRDEYYIKMMVAWYFATLLAFRYEETLPYLTEGKLDVWTHNKTIRKAIESFRIPDSRKQFLRSLTVKNKE